MAYKLESTENPLGHKPWSYALSNSGLNGLLSRGQLGVYDEASFVIPTNTILTPDQTPRWNPPGLGKYYGSNFPVPMGDYQTDPSTLPPAPAGQMYNASYQLVPVPQASPVPWVLLGLLAAGGAYWYFTQKKASMKLPVVSPATAGVKL